MEYTVPSPVAASQPAEYCMMPYATSQSTKAILSQHGDTGLPHTDVNTAATTTNTFANEAPSFYQIPADTADYGAMATNINFRTLE